MQPERHVDIGRFHVLIADRPCLECQVQRLAIEKIQPVTTGKKGCKSLQRFAFHRSTIEGERNCRLCQTLYFANKRTFECGFPQRNFEIVDPLHSVAKIDLS